MSETVLPHGALKASPAPKKIGLLKFNPERGLVWGKDDGENVRLSPEQNLFLKLLVEADGAIVSKADLYQAIHKHIGTLPDIKIIDVVICHVRRKLNTMALDAGDHIATVWGSGYRLSQEPVTRSKLYREKRGKQSGLLRKIENLRTSLREAV